MHPKQPIGGRLHFDKGFPDRDRVGQPDIRQLHAFWQALEQLDAKMMLQLADLLADGGRRQVQLLRGRAEGTVTCRCLEGSQPIDMRQPAHGSSVL